MCHHRPGAAAASSTRSGSRTPHLAKGEMAVLHLRRGEVAAVERHQAG